MFKNCDPDTCPLNTVTFTRREQGALLKACKGYLFGYRTSIDYHDYGVILEKLRTGYLTTPVKK